MSASLLRMLAMTIGPSLTAAARPITTFFAIQVTVFILVNRQLATIPHALEWVISLPALIVVAALVILENLARHDTDVASLMRAAHIDEFAGACGTLGAVLLFTCLGMPEAGAGDVIDDKGGILDATAETATTDHHFVVQASVVLVAVAVNLGLTRLRSLIFEYIQDYALGKWWARIETGGVVGLLVLLPVLPLVVFGFLLVFTVGLTIGALALGAAHRAVDRRRRQPCENCGHQLRVEASLCPECHAERQPTDSPRSGLAAAWNALRDTGDHDEKTET